VRADGNDQWRRWLNLVLSITQAIAPVTASLGLGAEIGARSDAVNTLLTPAGWAFAIWAPLFAGCLAYAIDQFRPRKMLDPVYRRIGWFTAAGYLANTLWELDVIIRGITPVSALLILALLTTIMFAHTRLAHEALPLDRARRWIVAPAIGGLAGWITAASLANIASALKAIGFTGGDEVLWMAAAVLLVGTLVAVAVQVRHRASPWYALTFGWALFGIASAAFPAAPAVGFAAIAGAAGVIIVTVFRLGELRRRQHWLSGAVVWRPVRRPFHNRTGDPR